jgi:hypothetical protein
MAFSPRDGRLARHRPAAGLLLGVVCGHHGGVRMQFFLSLTLLGKAEAIARPDCNNARDRRANRDQRRMLCFSSSAR